MAQTYVSELGQAMIVLKDGNFPELVHSFLGADGGFWVVHKPFSNQIETKLHIGAKSSLFDLSVQDPFFDKEELRPKFFTFFFFIFFLAFSYLMFCKTHLDDSIGIPYWMKWVTVVSLPSAEIRRFLGMAIVGGDLGQQWLSVA